MLMTGEAIIRPYFYRVTVKDEGIGLQAVIVLFDLLLGETVGTLSKVGWVELDAPVPDRLLSCIRRAMVVPHRSFSLRGSHPRYS